MSEAAGTVAVVGLGKIGLPLAVQYASRGYTVIGCDINPRVVELTNRGESHVLEEADLAERVREQVRAGRLSATTDVAAGVRLADVVVCVVPLVVDESQRVDFRSIDAATSAIAAGLRRGALVIFETTLPVGTTRGRLGTLLERGSGLRMGTDFRLAFSPERVYSGRIFEDLGRYPKIVGGIDAPSTAAAVRFYRAALGADVREMQNSETAEFVKLAETTYRDVNIALANELARYAEARGIDANAAFRAANTQPFSHLHTPGVGVGGHCIPVYPYFLIGDARDEDELRLPRLGRRINDGMAEAAVDRIEVALGGLDGRAVLILGLSYRENVKEDAFSVTKRLIPLLRARGARVLLDDPLYSEAELATTGAIPVRLSGGDRASADAVLIQAYHREYEHLDWSLLDGLSVVFDGRGALSERARWCPGVRYLAFGAAGLPAEPSDTGR